MANLLMLIHVTLKRKIMMEMFCYQCQETAQNKGCTIKGVCGKEAITSNMIEPLLYAHRGEAIVHSVFRVHGCAS